MMLSLLKLCIPTSCFNTCCSGTADIKYRSACCEKEGGTNMEMSIINNNTPTKCGCSLFDCCQITYSSNQITPQPMPSTLSLTPRTVIPTLQEKK